jgi:hypothetical protein
MKFECKMLPKIHKVIKLIFSLTVNQLIGKYETTRKKRHFRMQYGVYTYVLAEVPGVAQETHELM